jgi:hypothetical protein
MPSQGVVKVYYTQSGVGRYNVGVQVLPNWPNHTPDSMFVITGEKSSGLSEEDAERLFGEIEQALVGQ